MSFVSSDHFVKVTSKMRKSGRLSDAKIILDDGSTFKIHKMLLAMGSSFFEKMFSRETGKTEYKISMVTFGVMDQILDWMYCHKLALTEENLPEILKTAHYMDCFEVVDQCSKYLLDRLDPENAIGFWNFAVIYQMKELEGKFMSYLTYHFRAVVKQEEFLELPVENLIQILKSDDLNMDEGSIFYALMSWVAHDSKQRLICLEDSMKTIRLGCLTPTFFHKVVFENPIILEAEKKVSI